MGFWLRPPTQFVRVPTFEILVFLEISCWWPETIGAAKPTQRVSKSVRSAQTIPSTKSAATNITREQFYDCALELSSAIHMQEVMKSNSKKVDPLAVHAFVSFRLSHMPLQP